MFVKLSKNNGRYWFIVYKGGSPACVSHAESSFHDAINSLAGGNDYQPLKGNYKKHETRYWLDMNELRDCSFFRWSFGFYDFTLFKNQTHYLESVPYSKAIRDLTDYIPNDFESHIYTGLSAAGMSKAIQLANQDETGAHLDAVRNALIMNNESIIRDGFYKNALIDRHDYDFGLLERLQYCTIRTFQQSETFGYEVLSFHSRTIEKGFDSHADAMKAAISAGYEIYF